MLGIFKQRNVDWLGWFGSIPSCLMEIVSFGYLRTYRWRIYRNDETLLLGLAGLGTCLVVILSFGHFDCDWIGRAVRRE